MDINMVSPLSGSSSHLIRWRPDPSRYIPPPLPSPATNAASDLASFLRWLLFVNADKGGKPFAGCSPKSAHMYHPAKQANECTEAKPTPSPPPPPRPPAPGTPLYHEKVISPGFSTMGSNR